MPLGGPWDANPFWHVQNGYAWSDANGWQKVCDFNGFVSVADMTLQSLPKPKRGPPFKPPAERKSVYVGLRLTTASAEWLEAERQQRNLTTLGQVVRQLIAERVERSKLEAVAIE